MFSEPLKKILNLIKATGDRVVIFDGSHPADSYVVMNFDNYAELRTGNKTMSQRLLAEEGSEASTSRADFSAESTKDSYPKENLTEEDLTDKINREISMWKNRDNSAYLGEENKPKKAWSIPAQVKDKAQEIE